MTLTTPPVFASAMVISSVRLRGTFVIARHAECVATTGFVEVFTMSQNVLSETCETSTIMPSRFISRTTCFPKSFKPRVLPISSPDDPAQLVLTLHAGDRSEERRVGKEC